ncbi:hypothetical protein ACFP3U_29710 [Kitasatospora misakiensis]|uniref:DUF1616 domain-containing protein n=1 Tax=Kitasatospora misakiensis TaxID=67330 RepID=A0ABW0XDG6_9ACTN
MTPAVRAALLALAWLAPAATALPDGNAVRVTVLAVAWVLLPGLPLALRLPPERGVPERSPAGRRLRLAVLTVAGSLGCATLVSELLRLSGALTVSRALLVLAVLDTAAVLVPSPRRTGERAGRG